MKTLAAALAVLLAACAVSAPPRPRLYWQKAGASELDYRRSVATCNRAVPAVYPQSSKADLDMNTTAGQMQGAGRDLQDTATIYANMADWEDCMRADGWVQRP